MGDTGSQDVSLDALIFFATHSLIVIALAAVVFFGLGLWVGFLSWAKFKRRARAYYEEVQLQRREIANLKRRIAEEAVEAGAGEETTPLLSAQLFEAARSPLAEEAEAELPEPDEPTPPAVVEPKRESLAAAVLGPLRSALKEMKAGPATITKTESVEVPPTTIEFPAPEPKEIPLQLPEIPSIKAAGAPGVNRALARSVDGGRAALGENAEEPDEPVPDEMEKALAEGKARMDDKLGLLYHDRPDRHDDLTLLRGIGEALHVKLQEQGIYTFKQIGLWTEENIREFDQRLLTKDRIRREHWVKQARNLHFLKYGEELKQAVVQTE